MTTLAILATATGSLLIGFIVGAYMVLRDFGSLIDDGYAWRNATSTHPSMRGKAVSPAMGGEALRRTALQLVKEA